MPSFFREEISNHPRYRSDKERLLELCDRWRAELILPLVFERKVRGLVSFSGKRTNKEYSAEDLRLLGTLVDQLALSLENGKLYEETVKAYDEAAALNRRLIEMDRVKKQFVANICHELRTPLSTIIGYGEILRDTNFQGDARDLLDRLVNIRVPLENANYRECVPEKLDCYLFVLQSLKGTAHERPSQLDL